MDFDGFFLFWMKFEVERTFHLLWGDLVEPPRRYKRYNGLSSLRIKTIKSIDSLIAQPLKQEI